MIKRLIACTLLGILVGQSGMRQTLQAQTLDSPAPAESEPSESKPADAKPVESKPDPPKNFSEQVRAGSEMLNVFLEPEAQQPLEMVRAYKWANTARKPLGDRLCLLFLDDGYPVASCKIYPTFKNIVHTPISMTDSRIEGRIDDKVYWLPVPSGLQYHRLDSEPAPAVNAATRRIQMKRLVRKFEARTDEEEAVRQKSVQELRLLPTPIHRYASKGLEKRGIIDGAVFCFVAEGGNPQILMLVEAFRHNDELVWRCAFSRRTFAELAVTYRNSEIWSIPKLTRANMKMTGTFHRIVSPHPVVAE